MPRLALVAPLLFWCVCVPAPASAQDAAGDSPAHISVVDGAALLERDGRSESAPASMPLLAGDRVRTQNGRVEILFNDGSTLHLDTNTLVDFQSDEVIRLLDGRVRLNIVGSGGTRSVAYRVDAPSAWVQIARPGEYRISVLGPGSDAREAEVELAVLRGLADLVNEDGRTSLGAGERAFARAGAGPSASYVFNSASWDAFDRWSEGRRDSRLGVSTEYLPDTVQPYAATFNQYGSWQNEPTYGNVWYPRVRAGWRPYYYGRWTTLSPWGWTWIGSDPWAWPTHHYGRWGFSAGAWFWIPGRTWGPAWVSWAYAPGYVSWCPLGWNNRAVFGFSSINGHRGYDRSNAWTVVPHRGFGRGDVNVNVVNTTRIDVRTRNSFVVRDAAPNVVGYAVPRSTAPIRSVGAPGGATNADNAAYRGARSAPGSRTSTDADPSAAFRSRRSSSVPIGSARYPAPSREPRPMSSLPSPTGQGASRSRDAGAPAAPGGRSIAVPDARSNSARRAVPRDVGPSSAPAAVSASPSRRAQTPESDSPASSSQPNIYRAVPRNERPGGRDNDAYAPPASIGGSRERSNRAPSQDAPEPAPRAMPRSTPDNSGPPAGYGYRSPDASRSRPGPERSAPAPSGPPPQSAAPSRPSGPPPSSSGGGESRSRSGGSTGRAVPRGGRS
jgi:FecR protein